MRINFFDSISDRYKVEKNDTSIMDKIKELEDRIIKLEDENISLTNELYRLENSLESKIDILLMDIYNCDKLQ